MFFFYPLTGEKCNTLLFSYDPVSISLVFPQNAPTQGNFTVTVVGNNFGLTAAVKATISGNSCPIVNSSTHNNSYFECTLPPGVAVNASFVVQSLVSGLTATTTYSYAAPSITNVTGCTDNLVDGSTSNCPNTGGQTITIYGQNFGTIADVASLSVTVGGNACNITAFLQAQVQLTCLLPGGVGFNVPVAVSRFGRGNSRNILSYAGPKITDGTLKFYDHSYTGGNIVGSSLNGGDIITLDGNFPQSGNGANVQVVYGVDPSWPQTTYYVNESAMLFSCAVLNSTRDDHIDCVTSPGIGGHLHFQVFVGGLPSQVGQDTFSYPPPTITSYSLHTLGGPNQTVLLSSTNNGEAIQFSGTNFGLLQFISSQFLKITYGTTGTEFACVQTSVDLAA